MIIYNFINLNLLIIVNYLLIMFTTSIFITEGRYADKVNFNLLDIYNKDFITIEWEGQSKKTTYDGDEFGVGSHIFYRPKNNKQKYFIYLGQVKTSRVIKERTETAPIKKKFTLEINEIKFCKYTDDDKKKDEERGFKACGKYFRAAMRKLHLKIKNGSQFQGAYKHESNFMNLLDL